MKYHSYILLSTNSNTTTPKEKKEFLKTLHNTKGIVINSYATVGLKKDTKMLLWLQSEEIEKIQDLLNTLMHTKLGENLKISYTLFGMTRPTQYSPNSTGHLKTDRKGGKYLVIYPFTKTNQWYQLPFSRRKAMMWGHVQIGKKHPKIEQLLLYSFGVDDNEFIVSYETDDLSDFQTLVMELRSDKVRGYTQQDTPIFTCIYKPLDKVLDYL